MGLRQEIETGDAKYELAALTEKIEKVKNEAQKSGKYECASNIVRNVVSRLRKDSVSTQFRLWYVDTVISVATRTLEALSTIITLTVTSTQTLVCVRRT